MNGWWNTNNNKYDCREITTLCAYVNRKLSVVVNRNCFPKMKDLKVMPPSGSHVQRISGRIEEMVQDRHTVTTHH